jgi:kynurenine formamidase
MKIYDVTVAIIDHVPIYKGDPEAKIESAKAIAAGIPPTF